MLHVDLAESYKNYQQDAIRSGYFGNQDFNIFAGCYYLKSPNNDDVGMIMLSLLSKVPTTKESRLQKIV